MIGGAAAPAPALEETGWVVQRFWRRGVLGRLLGNPPLVAGAVLLLGFAGVAVYALIRFGNSVTTLAPNYKLGALPFPPGPSASHPFGVLGGIGVDLLSAMTQATPIDLALLGGPVLLAVLVGLVLGGLAGMSRRTGDVVVTVAGDLVSGVPPFFLVMVLFLGIQHLLRPEQYLVAFGGLFALVLWPYYARPVRARAKEVVVEPFVESARAAGASEARVLFRHVLPNSLYPVWAQVPIDVANILFVLTVFPYLGCLSASVGNAFYAALTPFPAQVYPEWGYLLATGACDGWSVVPQTDHWWMYGFPALVIVVFGIAVTLACDGLERAGRIRRG